MPLPCFCAACMPAKLAVMVSLDLECMWSQCVDHSCLPLFVWMCVVCCVLVFFVASWLSGHVEHASVFVVYPDGVGQHMVHLHGVGQGVQCAHSLLAACLWMCVPSACVHDWV